jgi:DNA-damage-inducible protein J
MAQINIRIDDTLKKQGDELFRKLGLSFSSAVSAFVSQSVREGGIPFPLTVKSAPNAEPPYANALLLDAAEIDAAIANGTAKVYASPDELFAVWAGENG